MNNDIIGPGSVPKFEFELTKSEDKVDYYAENIKNICNALIEYDEKLEKSFNGNKEIMNLFNSFAKLSKDATKSFSNSSMRRVKFRKFIDETPAKKVWSKYGQDDKIKFYKELLDRATCLNNGGIVYYFQAMSRIGMIFGELVNRSNNDDALNTACKHEQLFKRMGSNSLSNDLDYVRNLLKVWPEFFKDAVDSLEKSGEMFEVKKFLDEATAYLQIKTVKSIAKTAKPGKVAKFKFKYRTLIKNDENYIEGLIEACKSIIDYGDTLQKSFNSDKQIIEFFEERRDNSSGGDLTNSFEKRKKLFEDIKSVSLPKLLKNRQQRIWKNYGNNDKIKFYNEVLVYIENLATYGYVRYLSMLQDCKTVFDAQKKSPKKEFSFTNESISIWSNHFGKSHKSLESSVKGCQKFLASAKKYFENQLSISKKAPQK